MTISNDSSVAQTRVAHQGLKDRLLRYPFGEDIFISYSRRDATTYAVGLANELASRNYSCKIDQWGAQPGKEIPEPLKRSLRRSALLVLVVTKGATESLPVQQEIEEYLKTGRIIIPIDIDGTITNAPWWSLIEGLPVSVEGPEALKTGNPSKDVINRIDKTFSFSRKDQRLRKAAAVVTSLVVLLILAGVVAGVTAIATAREASKQTNKANLARVDADRQTNAARDARAEAEKQQRIADANTKIANDATKRAEDQAKLAEAAEKQRVIAETKTTEARKLELVAKAEANTQKKIAFSRQLTGQSLSHKDRELDLALLLGLESYRFGGTVDPVLNFDSRRSLLEALLQSPNLTTFLSGHKSEPWTLAFSPDGKTLASGHLDGSVNLWDPNTQRLLPTTIHASSSVTSLAFNPIGDLLAIGTLTGDTFLWNRNTNQLLGSGQKTMLGEKGWLEQVEMEDGKPVSASVTGVAFSPDGKMLATGGCGKRDNRDESEGDDCIEGQIRLWDVSKRQELFSLRGHNSNLTSLSFSGDGKRLASSNDHSIILWDLETRKPLRQISTSSNLHVHQVTFEQSGRLVAFGSRTNNIIWWDVATGEELGQPLTGHSSGILAIAFSPDGITAASCGLDQKIILWNVTTRERLVKVISPHKFWVDGVAFSPDGNTLASSSGADNTTVLWDLEKNQPIGHPLPDHSGRGIAFSPDGKILASSTKNDVITLWDVATQQRIGAPLIGHKSSVWRVAFSPDGKTLASASNDGTVIVWNVATHQPLVPPLKTSPVRDSEGPGESAEEFPQQVLTVSFSPDGKLLAAGGQAGEIFLWDTVKYQRLPSLVKQSNESIQYLLFSPKGQFLVSGGGNGINVWDVSRKQFIRGPLTANDHFGGAAAFSPDGTTLVWAGEDGTVKLWDMVAQQLLVQLPTGDLGYDQGVAFSPDGKRVASNFNRGGVGIWDVSFESWQSLACRIANRKLTATEWAQYIGPTEARNTCKDLLRKDLSNTASAPAH